MHTSSLHKWHVLARSLTFIERHERLSVALLILILIGVMYGAAVRLESLRVLQASENVEISGGESPEMVRPLTRMMDPQYAHEYLVREQYLLDHLEDLRNVTQAERVYVVLYSYAFSRLGRGIEQHISNSFEVTREGIRPKIDTLHGTERYFWLQLKQDERWWKNELFAHRPERYGRELYDAHNVAIGYIGLEKQQNEALLPEQGIQLLRETAGVVTNALAQPIEQVKHSF